MPKYEVKRTLIHDGEQYEAGQEVEMAAKAAEPLLAAGAVAPLTTKAAKGDKGDGK